MNQPAHTPNDPPEVRVAVQAVEAFWGEMAQRWPWMRQQSLRPVYVLAGELLISLLRTFPTIIHSNQARWYARVVADTPSIYVLFPEAFAEEARKRVGASDPHLLEGKQAITFIYLTKVNQEEQVAKTLLLSTAREAPLFRAQVAHELLNCACATDWDSQQMRAGMRLVHWKAGAPLQRGGLLNDLLIDVLLLEFLPTAANYSRSSLLDGQQGPYWHIVDALGGKVERALLLNGLFGTDADRLVLEGVLNEAFERGDAALWLDQLLAARDWARLAEAMGGITAP